MRAIGAKRKQVMRSVMLESLVHRPVRLGDRCRGRHRHGAGLAAGVHGVRLRAARRAARSSTPRTIVDLDGRRHGRHRARGVPAGPQGREGRTDRGHARRRARPHGHVEAAGRHRHVRHAGGAAFIALGLSGGAVSARSASVRCSCSSASRVLGPVIARPFARCVGWPLPRLRGMAGTLARENATRNPRRTAATASALMIGVGLVAFITVFAASAKASIGDIGRQRGAQRLDRRDRVRHGRARARTATQAHRRAARDRLGHAAALRDRRGRRQRRRRRRRSTRRTPGRASTCTRSKATSTQLGPNDVAVLEGHDGRSAEPGVGDTVTMTFAETGRADVHGRRDLRRAGPDERLRDLAGRVRRQRRDARRQLRAVIDAPGLLERAGSRTRWRRRSTTTRTPSVMTQDEFKGTVAARSTRC